MATLNHDGGYSLPVAGFAKGSGTFERGGGRVLRTLALTSQTFRRAWLRVGLQGTASGTGTDSLRCSRSNAIVTGSSGESETRSRRERARMARAIALLLLLVDEAINERKGHAGGYVKGEESPKDESFHVPPVDREKELKSTVVVESQNLKRHQAEQHQLEVLKTTGTRALPGQQAPARSLRVEVWTDGVEAQSRKCQALAGYRDSAARGSLAHLRASG